MGDCEDIVAGAQTGSKGGPETSHPREGEDGNTIY